MNLKKLSLLNFKNYQQLEVELHSGLNCFVGKNGSGKTNILDAVYYLCMCKSYLNPVDRQNIHFGEAFFMIQGTWEHQEKEEEVYCGVKLGHKKVVKKNKVEYEKLSDHIGQFPCVMISPYDRDLIAEGSAVRRKWIDGIISQSDREYLSNLITYTKVLERRNMLLKRFYENGLFEQESIAVWDEQLIALGKEIHRVRTDFMKAFVPVFQKYYEFIGGTEEIVSVEYRSQLNEGDFAEQLELHRRKDAQSQHSTCGIHKDDLLFTIQGNPIKKFGSQGQQKSFIIALRLAQFEWLTEQLQKKPLLMLDDIFDKLDAGRVERLVKLVSDHTFEQVLITDTDQDRIEQLFVDTDINYQVIRVDELEQSPVSYE
ncbi:MAG: DNA replication and repair protein RecF [Bacteroidetes bacterium]|nr:MAG: DNA replication and repair protein RecF [Bacteroidota bacterium]